MTGTRVRHHRTCSLCEAMCGLVLEVEGERVVSVRGDEQDPLSRGHMCPKGPALVGLHEDPDRLRRPMRRRNGTWEPVGWDEALDEAGARLHALQVAHGRSTVAVYVGNPAVHNAGCALYFPHFVRTLGTKVRYSATSVDQLPQMLAAYLMFGHQLLLPIPDLDRCEHLLIIGANPLVSNGSIMSAPDIERRLVEIRERGHLVVVDPRRTETAKIANEHVFVRPGTDAWLLGAMVHVLFEEDLVQVDDGLGVPIRGREALRDAVASLTPERASAHCGVPAPTIRDLTRRLAAAPRAVVYGRVGVSMHPFGGLCHWFVNALNVLTGNVDRPGGVMFPRPAFDIIGLGRHFGVGPGSFGRWRSKVRALPEFGGELPVATLAEDIEAGGETPIRGLVTIAGNPVLSTPDGGRLERAIAGLDYRVAVDFYLNETTRHADLVLPPTGPLEHGHFDVAFHALAIRNTVKYSPPIFAAGPEQRHDHQILAGLERALLRHRGASAWARASVGLRERLGPEGIVDLGLRLGPHGVGRGGRSGLRGLSMSRLRREPHGIDLGPLEPSLVTRLPPRRAGDHPQPHIDLAPEAMVGDLARLLASDAGPQGDALLLVGRRQLRSNNSWMHNVPKLIAGRPRCTLQMHRSDASSRGIEPGSMVVVRSRVGRIEVPADVGDEMMPGVVSLPHGFGHHRPGMRLRVAEAAAGQSINDLTEAERVDELSAVAAFSATPVWVEPAT